MWQSWCEQRKTSVQLLRLQQTIKSFESECSHWIHLFRITQISRKGHLQRSMVFDNLDDILFTSNGQQLWILFSDNTDGKDSMNATPLLYMHMYFTFLNCYIRWLGRWLNRQPGKTWSTDLFVVHYRSITQACSDLQIHNFPCSKVLSTQVYWPKSLLGRKTSFCSPSCSLAESAVPPSAAVQTTQNWLRCEMTRLWHWMQTFQINDTSRFASWIQQQVTNFDYTVHGLKLMVDSSLPEQLQRIVTSSQQTAILSCNKQQVSDCNKKWLMAPPVQSRDLEHNAFVSTDSNRNKGFQPF